jgi:hypothetical protein
MTWKVSALTSGGASLLLAALAAIVTPIERNQEMPSSVLPQAVDKSGAVVDLGAQADRLKAKLSDVSAYQHPARDAFRFGPPPRPVAAPLLPVVGDASPIAAAPSRPPYGLTGMATTVEDGVTQRTAILSSLQGVSLVKQGDVLDGSYRVVSITDDTVTLESASDGTQTTLRLSN